MEQEYFRSGYEIRSLLRLLFNSDSFKNARFAKVKSPSEVVCGTLRLVGDFNKPRPRLYDPALEIGYMGQDLLNPPTVEGWHTGKEWIDSGTLLERVNYTAGEMGRINAPGIRAIIERLASPGTTVSAEHLLEGCLQMLGGYQLMDETHKLLLAHARAGSVLDTSSKEFAQFVGQLLQLLTLEIAFKHFLKMYHNWSHGKESFESSCQLAGVPPVPSLGAVPKGLEAERHRRGPGGYQRVDQPVGEAS